MARQYLPGPPANRDRGLHDLDRRWDRQVACLPRQRTAWPH